MKFIVRDTTITFNGKAYPVGSQITLTEAEAAGCKYLESELLEQKNNKRDNNQKGENK